MSVDVTTAAGSKVEIASMMCLSTGHVTEATSKLLEAEERGGAELAWSPQLTWMYGWIWYVDQNTAGGVDFPPEFEAIFKLATALDCNWVRFDCDGPHIAELPFYEW